MKIVYFKSIHNFNKFLVISLLLIFAILIFIEFYQDVIPCTLCIYQRIPYIIILISSILSIIFKKEKFYKLSLFITITMLVISMMIGLYHASIERGILDAPESCISNQNFSQDISVQDLDKIISNNHNVSCAITGMKIFGIGLSELNVLYALLMLIIITMNNFRNYKNKDKFYRY